MRSDDVPRPLNWAGHSLETIAAMYESDAACRELAAGQVDWVYLDAAMKTEFRSMRRDRLAYGWDMKD